MSLYGPAGWQGPDLSPDPVRKPGCRAGWSSRARRPRGGIFIITMMGFAHKRRSGRDDCISLALLPIALPGSCLSGKCLLVILNECTGWKPVPPLVLDLAWLAGNRIGFPRQLDSLEVPEPFIQFMGVGGGLGRGRGRRPLAPPQNHSFISPTKPRP